MKISTRLLAITALTAAAALAAPASAQTAGLIGFSGGAFQDAFGASTAAAGSTIGWAFTPTTNIYVSALGWRSDGNLDVAHRIGIWQGTTLWTSALTPTGAYANNTYAYTGIATLALMAGTQYMIAGLDGSDDDIYYYGASSVTTDPLITFNGGVGSAIGGGFQAPTSYGIAGNGRFGPNFLFSTAVPEPATWGMMILGFGMVGAVARYRRRSTKACFA